ncbi:protein EVI2A isoform X2 [Ailuropoda melanoleuca]|uniref:protein EVI2A isoform X2 n=1 Tax=Ailuropoda melanoleuca TaxID=9646 RepID=UPI0014948569|nr:protein EVI2A isoform X2 [Ailuropoda melanoleuca]
MEHTGLHLHLALLMTTFFSCSPGINANYTHLWANSTTVWDPDIQNKPGRNQNENINTNPTTSAGDKGGNSINRTETATSSQVTSLAPISELELYIPSVVRNSSPTVQSTENTTKGHREIFKKEKAFQFATGPFLI